jgi:hypothetical protein
MACDAKCQEEAAERRRVGAWSSPEREALLQRMRPTMGAASSADLLQFAMVELEDALDNVDPIEGGSEFHAGCCMMRAKAAVQHVHDRGSSDAQALALHMAKWIVDFVDHAKPSVKDHACAQCVPTSDAAIPGFVCGLHIALALLDAAKPQ